MMVNKKTESNVMHVKFTQPKIKFEYSASEAKEVSLVGNFNQWNSQANPMKKDKKGIWKVTLSLEPGRYEYRFIADGNWENDPHVLAVSRMNSEARTASGLSRDG